VWKSRQFLLFLIIKGSLWESSLVFDFFQGKKIWFSSLMVLNNLRITGFCNRFSWPVFTNWILEIPIFFWKIIFLRYFFTKKLALNIFLAFYKSTISFFSRTPPNCSYFSSRFGYIVINPKKLEGDLQPTFQSLDQFLFTNNKFSKFSNYKWHLFKLLKIPTKEKILSIFIWESTIPKIWRTRNPIVWNMVSCFSHHWRGHFISFTST
jgi:hypothetical protein